MLLLCRPSGKHIMINPGFYTYFYLCFNFHKQNMPVTSFIHMVITFRYEVDRGDYKCIDKCKDVTLLASAFKFFLREIQPEPLITIEARDRLYAVNVEKNVDADRLVPDIQKALQCLDPLAMRVLKYVLQHLKRVSDVEGNNTISG